MIFPINNEYYSGFYFLFGTYYKTIISEVGNVEFSSCKSEYFNGLEQYLKYNRYLIFSGVASVVVWVWVGKEFPDMKQNERGK